MAVDQFYELGEGIGAGSSQGPSGAEQTLGGSSRPMPADQPQTLGGSSAMPAGGASSSDKSRSTRPRQVLYTYLDYGTGILTLFSSGENSKFRTLNDLNRADSAEDSDDEHQNLYAGGEKS